MPEHATEYRKPVLKVYGDVRGVTLTSLTQNMNDPTNSSQTMT
jgi:hypothetical protein